MRAAESKNSKPKGDFKLAYPRLLDYCPLSTSFPPPAEEQVVYEALSYRCMLP